MTFPKLNERQLTVDDFYTVAGQFEIEIFELKLRRRGYALFDYQTKEDFIVLKKGMNELMFLETIWHEWAHTQGLNEFEANAFRLIAMIPLPKLLDYSWLEENPTHYAYKLWKERRRVYFFYGI